ncbi:MAG: IS200/IS605 family transposase [Proteobacteria bacterium]|nr:IS200/IS605 family transposase [Pseudomonadota bacterium]
MEVRKGAHEVWQLQYHVVWVTKYRRRILKPFVVEYLKKVLPKLLRSMPGVSIETIGFDNDHVHMVIVIPPKYSVSSVMGRLKGQSSHHMRKTFAWWARFIGMRTWSGRRATLLAASA